jgi:uncharacterized protein
MSRVVHFEIHADDPQRAVTFYRNVLDWQINKWEGPEDYWLISTGPVTDPGINGAILQRRHPIDGEAVIAFVCTVDVSSVDDTIEKVTSHGGSIVLPKMAIPQIGWLSYAKDTEGNIFGFMQSDPKAM